MKKFTETEKEFIKKSSGSMTGEEKTMVKLGLLHMYGFQRKIIDFKEKLITNEMENISIYDFPFVNIDTITKLVKIGINTAKDLFTYDLNELSKSLSESELEEVFEFGDTVYIFIQYHVIEGC